MPWPQRVSNSPCIVISTSSFHLLLIIFVSSTNCPLSLANSEQIDRIVSQTGQAKSTSIAPTTQDPFEEQPAIEKVKGWNRFQLLQWIQRKRPLEKDELENFEAARISGSGFLRLAGDVEFFKRECHLPVGPSLDLAELAREIAGGEIKQGKLLSFIPYSKH
jgi:hypothetical protein